MNVESRWEGLSERGSMRAIRLMGRLYEIMGRRLALLLLLPISSGCPRPAAGCCRPRG